jgi:signal transduction histidine kinase
MDRPIRVLYVDDNIYDRELVRDALEREHSGYLLFEATTRAEFEARLQGESWDLVLSDFNILGFDGLQIIESVLTTCPNVPVIIVTGTGSEEIAAESIRRGASDYVIKSPQHLRHLPITIQHVLERRAAQEALIRSRAMMARAERIAHVGSWTWDVPTDRIEWSEELFCLFGRDPALGAPSLAEYGQFFPPEDAARERRAIEAALAEGTPYELELRVIRADGEVRHCLALGYAETDPAGKAIHLHGAFQDITERKRLEEIEREYAARLEETVRERTEELRDAQEKLVRQERLAVLGQLAGGVGHELRNPLGIISNAVYYLRLLLEGKEAQVAEYLEIIENETRNAEQIIADLLDYARASRGVSEPVAAADLVQQVLERNPVPVGVTLSVHIDPDLPPAHADRHQMERVLGNLLVNAYQAMPEGGALEISAGKCDQQIAITVTDAGMGIPPDDLSQIFEPLFTTKARGIGLGLAICKNLVEANGGWIEVQSTPEEGSTFAVYLPTVMEGQ